MGLFSKLLGDVNRQLARTAANEIVKNVQQQATTPQPAPQQNPSQPYAQAAAPEELGPSGFSWGPTMPAEENQYSYKGSYIDYFMNIFRAEFPQYQITCKPSENMQYVLITFNAANRTALVVELLSRKSSPVKLRQSCRQQGIPYLRFYYDYEGWWNTRAYVNDRVRKALGI